MRILAISLPLDLLAPCAHFAKHSVDTVLIDGLHRLGGYPQLDPTALGWYPKTLVVQIRLKATLGSVIGMGNPVSRHRLLAGYLTHLCHASIVLGLSPFRHMSTQRFYN